MHRNDRIDLHTHSKHSDGTLTPADLVELAATEGLSALALTDHDTTSGVEEAIETGARVGVEVLAGCEISTSLEGRSVHVLAHAVPLAHGAFQAFLEEVRGTRVERNRRMLARLAELDCPLTIDEVEVHAEGSVVARPHFAKAMIERGYVPDWRAAFDQYLKDGGPAYVVVERASPVDAVTAICDAGGVASIAHPRQIALEDDDAWNAFFGELAAVGLAGIEVDHPSHRQDDRAFFTTLAERFDLVPTGGSDFHGANKPRIRIGTGNGTIDVRYETWERLRERRTEPRGA